MTTPPYRAVIRPELPPFAQQLVAIYDATPGSSGPYCCPKALAAVLDFLAAEATDNDLRTDPNALRYLAATLRALADYQPESYTEGPRNHWSPDDRTRRELRIIAQELDP